MDDTVLRMAVLYADVSGSTRIYEKYGDQVARHDIGACLRLLTETAGRFDGKMVKSIGDEIMCTFPSALKAALAAAEMHQKLSDAGDSGAFTIGKLHVKIGWHYGPVYKRQDELIGEAPVAAQQVISLAKADEILTTGRSAALLPPELREKTHCIDTVQATAWVGPMEVFAQSWEETDDVTSVSSAALHAPGAEHSALVLEHGAEKVRLDAEHAACSVGRAVENALHVHGRFTSRVHGYVEYLHGNFHIRDQSVNGIFIHHDDGRHTHLHREQAILSGSGTIGFGSTPEEEPEAAVRFQVT